jgi:hypothetical protein
MLDAPSGDERARAGIVDQSASGLSFAASAEEPLYVVVRRLVEHRRASASDTSPSTRRPYGSMPSTHRAIGRVSLAGANQRIILMSRLMRHGLLCRGGHTA